MKNRGFIIQIVIIVLALGALAFYFGLDVLNFLKNPEVKKYILGVGNTLKLIWSYVQTGFNYVVSLVS